MSNKKIMFILAIVAISAAGCSQKAINQKVDQDIKNEPPIAMGGPIAAESRRLIAESKDLSQEQKDKLIALHAKMAGDMKSLREEEGKLKMVFFKSLFNSATKEAELSVLKKRVMLLERTKTDKMLSAYEEVRKILGRTTLTDDQLQRAFMIDMPGHAGYL